ncbi:MAG: HlyD family type I secretion periplasmic adaptor subunit [Magnetococcales bacterium]|nr:HlyD family type I secretion periplasmic adaptor subunit [Magnetococcales bacterium]
MSKHTFSQHLSEALILEEAVISWKIRLLLMLTIVGGFLFFFWSLATQIDEAVKTTGQFSPQGSVYPVQPPEGGILAEVAVKEGELVDKGALLARLNNDQTSTDRKQTQARQAALQARAARLTAFMGGEEADFSAIDPEFAEVARDQRSLLRTQLTARQTSLQVIDSQLEQKKSEVEQITDLIRSATRRVGVDGEVMALRDDLASKNLASKVSQLDSKRTYLNTVAEISRLEQQLAKSRHALGEVEKRREALESELRTQASQELGQVNQELAQVRESLTRLEDRRTHLEIRTPVRGRVQDLRVRTIGAVVKSGDMLMQIVPVDDDLLLEAQISPRDIGFIHPGQTVVIKVASYGFERFGGVTGQLVSVSPFTRMDPLDKKVYYTGLIRPSRRFVGENPEANPILPGMWAQADITTGRRSVLTYLLKPLLISHRASEG